MLRYAIYGNKGFSSKWSVPFLFGLHLFVLVISSWLLSISPMVFPLRALILSFVLYSFCSMLLPFMKTRLGVVVTSTGYVFGAWVLVPASFGLLFLNILKRQQFVLPLLLLAIAYLLCVIYFESQSRLYPLYEKVEMWLKSN